jgi:hypothetical protein
MAGAAALGSGADIIYPRKNRSWAEKIMASGAVISEVSEGMPVTPQTGSLFEQSLTPDQKSVYDLLKPDAALFVDSILGSLPRVLAALVEFEMSGLNRQ